MRRPIEPHSASGWLWFVSAALLVAARLVDPWAGVLALGLMLAQVIWHYMQEDSWDALSVQVRVVFAALIFTAHLHHLGPLLWLPAFAAALNLLADYCLVSRLLSFMPPHRTALLDFALLRQTLSPSRRLDPPASRGQRLSTASPFS